jgi:contact-dependent growth inhibition (CDI) system CdiI-like immunity protein
MFGSEPNNCNLPSEWAPYLQSAIHMSPKKSQGHKRQRPFVLGETPRRKKADALRAVPSQMANEQRTLDEPNGQDRVYRTRTHCSNGCKVPGNAAPLSRLSTGPLRSLIGQKIGLEYRIPKALEPVAERPMREADRHPGDLEA